MCATRTPRKHARRRSSSVESRPRECGLTPTAAGVEEVIRRVGSGRPMTVAELWGAAAVLGSVLPSRRMDVHVARVRVAVRLEELGA